MMANWWKIENKAIEGFLEEGDPSEKIQSEATSPLVFEESSELLSKSYSFFLISSDSDEEDSLTDASESQVGMEGDHIPSLFVSNPPSEIVIAVVMSSYHSDDNGLPPWSTISVLQQLFADIDEDFDAEDELMDAWTHVSAITSAFTA